MNAMRIRTNCSTSREGVIASYSSQYIACDRVGYIYCIHIDIHKHTHGVEH